MIHSIVDEKSGNVARERERELTFSKQIDFGEVRKVESQMEKAWKHSENLGEKIVQTMEVRTENVNNYFSEASFFLPTNNAEVCKPCRYSNVLQNE